MNEGGRQPMRIGAQTFAWGERTFVMGILNLTPDSFSGDGLLADGQDPVERAVATARAMVADGADLIDIGGESTRPGHASVDPEAERSRVIPVLVALRAALPQVPLSIDTTKRSVAEAALKHGADLINDVGGTDRGNDRLALAADRGVPIVLMHGRDRTAAVDVVTSVLGDVSAAVERALARQVPAARIIVDPGIGFGKTPDQNLRLLRELDRFAELGFPLLIGTSRKSTLGRILDLPPSERVEGTLATTVLGVHAGVDIVRVHDVRANVRAARTADAIIRGWRPPSWEA